MGAVDALNVRVWAKGTSSPMTHRKQVRQATCKQRALGGSVVGDLPPAITSRKRAATGSPKLDSHVNVIITVACDQCSATLPLCAPLRNANSAQISEEATMSENAEEKKI